MNNHLEPKTNRFSAYFLAKTTFAKLMVLLLILAGGVAYQNLVKETYPDLEIGVVARVLPLLNWWQWTG